MKHKILKSILLFLIVILLIYSYYTFPKKPRFSSNIFVIDIIEESHNIANYMEGHRKFQNTIDINGNLISSAEYIGVAAQTIKFIQDNENPDLNQIANIPFYQEPANQYPDLNLLSSGNEDLYTTPLTDEEYSTLINQILFFNNGDTLPEFINIRLGQIRYPELIYLFSGILRFYKFYGYLPQSHALHIISPKGDVPWEVPPDCHPDIPCERYTSVLGVRGNTLERTRYYLNPAHYYELFKFAKSKTSGRTTPYDAGNDIYFWSTQRLLDYDRPPISRANFGRTFNSIEWMKFRQGTSGTPKLIMESLMRSINLPHNSEVIYADNRWALAEYHYTYGRNPQSARISGTNNGRFIYNYDFIRDIPFVEPDFFPSTDDLFISRIKNIISFSGNLDNIPTKAIFINSEDIKSYGEDYIIDKLTQGGFNAIVFTAKSNFDDVYFLTTDSLFEEDLLTSLNNKATLNGVKTYVAFSVLGHNAISPCDLELKERQKSLLTDLTTNHPNIDGIILSSLYFHPPHIDSTEGGSLCSSFRVGSDWKEDFITSYVEELYSHIKSSCPNCDVKILSEPIDGKNSDYGHDFDELSSATDGIILSMVENTWLIRNNFYFPPILDSIFTNSGKKAGISFYLNDEWEFPSEFYNGLMRYSDGEGANFIILHSPISLDGKYGSAFTKRQFNKLAEISTAVSCSEDSDGDGICDNLDNCPLSINPLQEDLDNDSLGDICDNDADNDGYIDINQGGSDCNDLDAQINPGELEFCEDGNDNDCDGNIDALDSDCTTCEDLDGDGYGNGCPQGFETFECDSTSFDPPGINCPEDKDLCNIDTSACVICRNPGMTEVCDFIDNDCLNGIDDGCDSDSDGYCNINKEIVDTTMCIGLELSQCDNNQNRNPGIFELSGNVCTDGIDNNCDTKVDRCGCVINNARWSNDIINTGQPASMIYDIPFSQCENLQAYELKVYSQETNDLIEDIDINLPQFESYLSWNAQFSIFCNAEGICKSEQYYFTAKRLLDNVNPIKSGPLTVLDECDTDGDLFLEELCIPSILDRTVFDCDDTNININPEANEVCDGVDNNCDGIIDEGCFECITNAECSDNLHCSTDVCTNNQCSFDLTSCNLDTADVNSDGTISINDLVEITLAFKSQDLTYDVNSDNIIDMRDLVYIASRIHII